MKASALTEYQPSYMICLFLLLFRNLLRCTFEKCLKVTHRLHLDKNSVIYGCFTEFYTETLSSQGNRGFPMRNPTTAAGCPKMAHTVDSIKPVMVTNENENISLPFRLPICISVNTDTRIEVISGLPSTSSGFSGTSSHS